MESNEISIHEVRIWLALECGKWMSNSELAKAAHVAERTATHHTRRLTSLGLLDLAEVFPGHRYRLSDRPTNATPVTSTAYNGQRKSSDCRR